MPSSVLSLELDPMGTESVVMLDPMAPPSPTVVCNFFQADEAGRVFSLKENGTADTTVSLEPQAPESIEVGSHSDAPEEKTNPPETKEEQLVSVFLEENLKQENNGLEHSSTAAATDGLQEGSSGNPSNGLEHEALVQTAEAEDQEGKEEGLALTDEQQTEVPDAMDVVNQDEVPPNADEQHQKQEVASSQGGELLKQEVARRSHILGSLSKLDESSARQLLNDSGWNVTQSVRMNGKPQWYYRSPPPKPVLVGSLTSAMAVWKKSVDEDHKKNGGGDDDDPYPMVTAFLSNVKRPVTVKKRKRGRAILIDGQ